ncbi:MAG: copper resistance CopC/CopD family protein [Marmoricola sp.]
MTRRLLVALAAAVGLSLLSAAPAAAHDEVVGSVPADGYTVTELPATARLTFGEETAPDDVSVKVAGRTVPVSGLPGDRYTVVVDLGSVVATATVKLVWRAVDEHDGHLTTGTIAFHVLDHDGTTVLPPTPTPTPGFSSVPADGYTVTTLPAQARLSFPAPFRLSSLRVHAAGRLLPVKAVSGQPGTVVVDLTGVRATESVTLDWQLGTGARAKAGAVTFHVLDHVAAVAVRKPPAPPLHDLSVLTHVVGYLAMAVLLGGMFFVSVLWPVGARDRRTRAVLVSALLAGGASAVTAVYIAVHQVAPLPFRDAVAQHFGRVSVALALMWLLAVVVVVALLQAPGAVRRPAWRIGALVVGIGLIRTTGMSAHGTQGSHATLGVLVDFLHLAAVSAWVGGLVVLLVGLLPRRELAEIERVVPRFSKVAATSVVLVLISGTLLAIRVIGSVGGIFTTHYGHVLLVKLTLVGLVLLVALVSKRWVEKTLAEAVSVGRNSAVRSFMASVGAETALVVAVLGVASLLVTSNPGT